MEHKESNGDVKWNEPWSPTPDFQPKTKIHSPYTPSRRLNSNIPSERKTPQRGEDRGNGGGAVTAAIKAKALHVSQEISGKLATTKSTEAATQPIQVTKEPGNEARGAESKDLNYFADRDLTANHSVTKSTTAQPLTTSQYPIEDALKDVQSRQITSSAPESLTGDDRTPAERELESLDPMYSETPSFITDLQANDPSYPGQMTESTLLIALVIFAAVLTNWVIQKL